MKSKDKIKHICLVRPANSTQEHADVLAVQAANFGVKTCFLNLNRNTRFSWLNWIICRAHILFRRSSYIFLGSPYLEHQPSWLVRGNFKLAYAGYGLTLSNWEFGHFSAGLTEKCKILIAGSEYEFLGYHKAQRVSQKILLAGNPLMWQIRDQIKKESIQKFGVRQILWAPHWSSRWMDSDYGYSRWREKAPVIFEFAKMHPGIYFVFRPHPLLRASIFETSDKNNKIYQREIQKEAEELKTKPEEEQKELELIYRAKGVPRDVAAATAAHIMEDPKKALDTLAREELGLNPDELGSPVKVAVSSFIAFAIGASIAVLPYLFLTGTAALVLTIALSTISLFVVGGIVGKISGRGIVFSALRQFAWGAGAAAVTFAVGSVIGVNV